MSPAAPFRAGAGRPCLDLIRTLRHRGRDDEQEELFSADRWDAWVRQFDLDCGIDDDSQRDRRARALREHLAALIGAATDSGPQAIRPVDLAAVNAAAARPVPVPQLGQDGTLRYVSARPGAAVRALLARDALELVATADRSRLRRCADADCRTVFLDTSRPGSRRWCTMAGCGARAKKADQRARERARPGAR